MSSYNVIHSRLSHARDVVSFGAIDENYNEFLNVSYQVLRWQNCWSRASAIKRHNEEVEQGIKKEGQYYGWTHLDCSVEIVIDIVFFITFLLTLYVFIHHCRKKAWNKLKRKVTNQTACCSRKIFKASIGKILSFMILYNFGKFSPFNLI